MAPQVAVAEHSQTSAAASQTAARPSSPSAAQPKAAESKDTPKTAKPSLRVSQIGMSWGKLRQASQPKMQIPTSLLGADDKTKNENLSFTQEDLELQWLSMCNRMPQELSGIAARLKNMNPSILEMPEVEVVVPNEIIKQEVETIRAKIISTLRLYLHNSLLNLSIRVAECDKQERILTRREQFEFMTSQNPSVGKLREIFDLELA